MSSHASSSIWFGSADGILFQLGGWINVNNYNSTITDMKSMFNVDTLFDIYTDATDEIWIATDKGLYTTSNLLSTTSVNENVEQNIFYMYPNPSIGGEMNINVQKESELMIYSSTGQLIYNKTLTIGKNAVSINVNPGFYIVNVSGVSKTLVIK